MGGSTNAELHLNNGEVYQPRHPDNANVWHFYTPYFDLEGLAATIYLNAERGLGKGLVISGYCSVLKKIAEIVMVKNQWTKTAILN